VVKHIDGAALARTVTAYRNGQSFKGRSPTEATRLRFDQESRLHLIHGESSSHRGRGDGRSAITN
jgi:hypothetical protein